MTSFDWSCSLPSEKAVSELAAVFAGHLQVPLVMYLHGDLGAGKTTFARALIQAMGHAGRVKSPSYGLLEPYTADGKTILHLDLYRIESAEELEYLAIRDLFDLNSLLLVEWPDKGRGYLPEADIDLNFDEKSELRFLQCKSYSVSGEALSRSVRLNSNMEFRD